MEFVPSRFRRSLGPPQQPGDDPGRASVGGPDGLTPPLLIGGVTGPDSVQRGIDWLTVTVESDDARRLLEDTRFCEVGYAKTGFRQSERRDFIGGKVWRRWEPVTASKSHGLAYESWEVSGGDGGSFLECLTRLGIVSRVRPTRVDVAWTFDVVEDVYPDSVLTADVLELAKSRRFPVPVSGEFPTWTRYIGAHRGQSARLLRVYRKDLQDPALGFVCGGPLLRVELCLRGDAASSWWPVFIADAEAGYSAAAAHVEYMTGRRVQSDVSCIPPVEVPEQVDEAQALLQFMKQYPEVLQRLVLAPADVRAELSQIAESQQSQSSRERGLRRRRKFVEAGGWPVVLEVIRRLCAGPAVEVA